MNEMEEFFRKRPEMQKKYNFPGTFREFAADIAKSLKPAKKKSPLTKAIVEEAKRILSRELSLDFLEDQLSGYPIISYADHHGLLNHSLLYNSNILYSEIIKELKLPFVVVFATGNIPLLNKSYPRGFYFKTQKFNFFSAKQSRSPVFLFKDKLCTDKKKGIDSLLCSYDGESLTGEEIKFLEFLFFYGVEIDKATDNYEIFSDQITFLNYKLWKYYYNKDIRDSIPNILYLQCNEIILRLLVEEIKKKNSLLSLMLFDTGIRRVFLENFYGIPCCWGKNSGSQFFWGIKERKKGKGLVALQLDDSSNSLVGKDFKIELEEEIIIDGLKTKKILQTIFLDLFIIAFLEGYLTLGGFNQIDYLPRMQQAYLKSFREIGMNDMADEFASRITDGLICGMLPFNFSGGIDLIWSYNSTDGKFNGNLDKGLNRDDLNKIHNIPVKKLISPGIETMLEIV